MLNAPTSATSSANQPAHRRPPRPWRPWRGTKIVATLGPASTGLADVVSLARAGVDVFRLNFSHGSHEDHKKRYDIIADAGGRHRRMRRIRQQGAQKVEHLAFAILCLGTEQDDRLWAGKSRRYA